MTDPFSRQALRQRLAAGATVAQILESASPEQRERVARRLATVPALAPQRVHRIANGLLVVVWVIVFSVVTLGVLQSFDVAGFILRTPFLIAATYGLIQTVRFNGGAYAAVAAILATFVLLIFVGIVGSSMQPYGHPGVSAGLVIIVMLWIAAVATQLWLRRQLFPHTDLRGRLRTS